MSALAVCPICSSVVRREQIRFGLSFQCSDCGSHLYVSHLYSCVHGLLAFGLGVLLLLYIGLTGWKLLFASILIWFPMIAVELIYVMPVFPPTLHLHQLKDSPLTISRRF